MKLWYSFTKELKLSSKTFYFYIELIMAALIIFILLVFIPENMTSVQDEYLTLDMPETVREQFLGLISETDTDGKAEAVELKLRDDRINATLYETDEKAIYIIPNREDLVELTKKDRPHVGAYITFDETTGDFIYEYHLQGYESERLQNLYKIIHNEDITKMIDIADGIKVKALDTGYEMLNSREMAVPSLLTFNGSLMGMFIIAAYIFLDKQEGIIKAYAVTASKVWQYLMSKVLVMTVVTIITTFAITIAVMGSKPNYPMLLVLLLTSSFFGSSFGLWISSFYDNMTKAFAAIYTAMMVLMLPAIAYFIPSWEPFWIKLIPTHYIIQGFKEIIIKNGDMTFVLLSSLAFLIAGLVFFLVSNYRFKKTLAA